jgi:hypothetical protein
MVPVLVWFSPVRQPAFPYYQSSRGEQIRRAEIRRRLDTETGCRKRRLR